MKSSFLNREEVLKLLAHRPAKGILIDEVLRFNARKKEILVSKFLDGKEYFFSKHFLKIPIMPAGILLEAIFQVGELLSLILIVNDKQEIKGKMAVLTVLKEAKFYRPVLPQQHLKMCVKIISSRLNRKADMVGQGIVDRQIVCEANFTGRLVQEDLILKLISKQKTAPKK